MTIIEKLYSEERESLIRAENLTDHELVVVRECFRAENMPGGSLILNFNYFNTIGICIARRIHRGIELYRLEVLPEFFRAIGADISEAHVEYMHLCEFLIPYFVRESSSEVFVQFQNATDLEKQQLRSADNIQYMIDRLANQELVKAEFKLED